MLERAFDRLGELGALALARLLDEGGQRRRLLRAHAGTIRECLVQCDGCRTMTAQDAELFAHYLERGAAPWNTSLAAAWLDYELRAWVLPRLPARRPLAVCNVGIGVGLWDDWLGHVLGGGASLVSVDRDPAICRVFAHRQRRELHPHPARVLCGDIVDGVLGALRFDVITVVGSTLREADDPRALGVLRSALADDGILLMAEVGTGAVPEGTSGVEVRVFDEMWIRFERAG